MTSARIEAAARADYNLSHGLEADDETSWNELGGQPRAAAIARATALVAAIDAADDRVRLTMPEFNAIKADAIYDVNMALLMSWDAESRAAAEAAGVPEFIDQYRARLSDGYLEPLNHEAAMASLVRERTAAAMRSLAEWFDSASLEDITGAMDLDASVTPRFKRIMIRGCADWLRTRADDLDSGNRRVPYYRVNTRAVIDQDQQTALLRTLAQVIDRSKRLASTDRITTPFIMTDMLVNAIESTGAVLPAEN
ncbi:hypothetical protein [Paenarthrobacter sp. YJN-5]|uniref:hypothetical protein n=1 Tax=Paenarthrobacter sp. YJN-5 TaxID=2735316 RepID=UPI001877F491|nr:hypothetical protein [Paenarthrobacter sp. YJN-5]QOT19592.1 hypothetical protein HMI59_23505 [Paenarthrobacter sp. YJN-5]